MPYSVPNEVFQLKIELVDYSAVFKMAITLGKVEFSVLNKVKCLVKFLVLQIVC